MTEKAILTAIKTGENPKAIQAVRLFFYGRKNNRNNIALG